MVKNISWLLIFFLYLSSSLDAIGLQKNNSDPNLKALIIKSKEMLKISKLEYEKQNYQSSYNISTKALQQIDSNYHYDGLVDDTGMYLVLAEIKKENKNIKISSKTLLIVLESRLNSLIYKESRKKFKKN